MDLLEHPVEDLVNSLISPLPRKVKTWQTKNKNKNRMASTSNYDQRLFFSVTDYFRLIVYLNIFFFQETNVPSSNSCKLFFIPTARQSINRC